jgi:hypothetical protein
MIPKHLLINFDTMKVGDKKWAIQGECTIEKLTDIEYGILVRLDNGETVVYARDGKMHKNDILPSLFNSNPFLLISEYPKEMLVKNNEIDAWEKHKVYGETIGIYIGEMKAWIYAKDIEPEPSTITLTMEEILEKVSKLEGKQVIVKI